MNRYLLSTVLAIAAAAATPAFSGGLAGDIAIDQPFVSTMTRDQVRGELQQFQQSGVDPSDQNFNQLAGFRSTTTRAQATAGFLQSRGEVAALTSEDSGSAYLAAHARRDASTVLAGQPVNAQ